jgi:hypothetical protein
VTFSISSNTGEQPYPEIAQLLLVLEGERPWVWRRIQVSGFAKLGGIHRTIQAIMGWDAGLSHKFILAGDIYGRVAAEEALPAVKERNWRLDSALYPSKEFYYVVGANFEWRHRIRLEDYVESVPNWRYPRCVDGAGKSPSGVEKSFNVLGANRRLWRQIRRR